MKRKKIRLNKKRNGGRSHRTTAGAEGIDRIRGRRRRGGVRGRGGREGAGKAGAIRGGKEHEEEYQKKKRTRRKRKRISTIEGTEAIRGGRRARTK